MQLPRHLDFPRSAGFDAGYWLCRCHGFSADSPSGRIGIVEEIHFGSRHDCPDELVIRTGFFAIRRLIVPVAAVERVVPHEQRLLLRSAATSEQADGWLVSLRRHGASRLASALTGRKLPRR